MTDQSTTPVVLFIERFAPEVEEQPRVEMTDWRIVKLPKTGRQGFDAEGVLVLVGYPAGKTSLRITSPFRPDAINFATRMLLSGSGRVYMLTTPPFSQGECAELWENFRLHLAINGIRTDADVSDDIWAAMLQASH